MDNPADFPPTMHYGVESQIPWLDINDDLPRIRTDDDSEMQRRWTAVGRPEPKDQFPASLSEMNRDSDTKDGFRIGALVSREQAFTSLQPFLRPGQQTVDFLTSKVVFYLHSGQFLTFVNGREYTET